MIDMEMIKNSDTYGRAFIVNKFGFASLHRIIGPLSVASSVRYAVFSAAILSVSLLSASASAQAVRHTLDGDPWQVCLSNSYQAERDNDIPSFLLTAIAIVESGRTHPETGVATPWPWSINANGKSYYLDSKREAIATVKRLRSRNIKSIDVGCMQVNLLHHEDAFTDLEAGLQSGFKHAIRRIIPKKIESALQILGSFGRLLSQQERQVQRALSTQCYDNLARSSVRSAASLAPSTPTRAVGCRGTRTTNRLARPESGAS